MIAVTGASGHIGANLIRRLLEDGQSVRVLAHKSRDAFFGLNLDVVEADICDRASLTSAFEGVEVVYHLAASVSILPGRIEMLTKVNVQGTENVIEACRISGVRRLVHFSSLHALEQEPLHTPLDESRSLVTEANGTAYDCSKAQAEMRVRQAIEEGLDAVVLYPSGVLGPNDFRLSHFGAALIKMASAKLPALVHGGCDWVDARDVAEAAVKAAARGRAGEAYILGGHYLSVREVADVVAEISGLPAARFISPLWLARLYAPVSTVFAELTGNRPLYTSSSLTALAGNRNIVHQKATAELGHRPRPFRETMVDTLLWYGQAGHLVLEQ
jgi:dihydroflavonol-4-reductase|tara:strand:+ start:6020 stop:7006 length:987 start_codon:yes stop_codon:yes gene_type:complete